MTGRMRSPTYPSTPLEQAIDMVRKLHQLERTNPVDREVAAKGLGYGGISGRSATVLSNLIQYGLLAKTGKNEVRVTERAVEILYPDNEDSKAAALSAAAEEPELFQRIRERFQDGMPSANALHSFFVKLGFTDTAIPSAIRAFQETFTFLENAIESGSHVRRSAGVQESSSDQSVDEAPTMNHPMLPPSAKAAPPSTANYPFAGLTSVGPDVRLVNKQIHIAGVLDSQADVDDVIETLTFLRAKVKPAPSEPAPLPTTSEPSDAEN